MAVTLTIPDDDAVIRHEISSSTTGPFNIDFPFFAESDVVVVYTDGDGDHTTYVKDTDYTQSSTADGDFYSGGSITLTSAVSAGTVTIYRDTPVERTANWPNGNFNIDDLNAEQNKIFAILQQFERDINRAVATHIADTLLDMGLPLVDTRKSKLFSFDSSGRPETATLSNYTGLSEFAQKYQVSASEPSARSDDTALQEGDIWFDTANDQWKVYDGSAYQIGASLTTPIGTADINDNAVTLAKMAALARGSIIYGDSSGDPAALAIGAADRLLKSDGTDLSYGQLTAGMVPNDLITLAMLAHGTADTYIGFNGSGVPAEVTPLFTESFTSSEIAVATGNQNYSAAHGLSGVPKLVRAVLVCKTADLNYSVGDEVEFPHSSVVSFGGSSEFTAAIGANSTDCIVNQDGGINLPNESSLTLNTITYANWRLKFYAFY